MRQGSALNENYGSVAAGLHLCRWGPNYLVFIRDIWRPRQELNLRPLAPEASALSAELRERDVKNHDWAQSTPRNIGTPSAVLHKAE